MTPVIILSANGLSSGNSAMAAACRVFRFTLVQYVEYNSRCVLQLRKEWLNYWLATRQI